MHSCILPEERFNNIMAKVEAGRVPFWTHLDLTYRCNQDCLHCYCQDLAVNFPSHQEELSTQEIFGLLDQLADMGSLHLTLSGGEVFLREDFFDIAFYAKKKHFTLKIFTNGTLIGEEAARRLAELTPLQVELSLYGKTADVHDRITQRKGSFRKTCEAVALLKKYRLRVELKGALMKYNLHQADEMKSFSLRAGADAFRMTLDISPKNDGSKTPQQHQVDEEQLVDFISRGVSGESVLDEYRDKPLERPLCQTGNVGCYISPYGDVYPCILLLVPMGNIRQKRLKEIWNAPSALREELDSLKTYGDLPSCRTCAYVSSCKNCIGLAHLETKDVRSCYKGQKVFAKAAYELEHERSMRDAQ